MVLVRSKRYELLVQSSGIKRGVLRGPSISSLVSPSNGEMWLVNRRVRGPLTMRGATQHAPAASSLIGVHEQTLRKLQRTLFCKDDLCFQRFYSNGIFEPVFCLNQAKRCDV